MKTRLNTKKKILEPRFYSVLIDKPDEFQYLWTGVAYTLEEAQKMSKVEMLLSGLFEPYQIIGSSILCYTSKTISDIESLLIESGDIIPNEESGMSDKTKVMQDCIKNKTTENKDFKKLNAAEKKYVKGKIKKDK